MDNWLVKLDRPDNSSTLSELLPKRNDPGSSLNPQPILHPNDLANVPPHNSHNDNPRRNQQHAHEARRAIQLLGLDLQLPSPDHSPHPHPSKYKERPEIHTLPRSLVAHHQSNRFPRWRRSAYDFRRRYLDDVWL